MSIEHVVVLCLENRSFDHLLGYLPHPDSSYNGLLSGGPHQNPRSNGDMVRATPDATKVLPYGPDHSHDAVMMQLANPTGGDSQPTHQGFVRSYELKAAGRSPTKKVGVLDRLLALVRPPKAPSAAAAARGPLVMRCQPPENVPVLSTLALEFAVCDNWYCSVPGETWANRNYLHAANSDGETNISVRPYLNPTIFERLEEHGQDWRIYHDEVPQILAFPRVWDTPVRHAKWFPFEEFAFHVEQGDLPAYSFLEPNHMAPPAPIDELQTRGANSGRSDSQHPENNLVNDAAYDTFVPSIDLDFDRAERLIASVYESLRKNPDLFATTVLVITYDEHGGFYDHAPAGERVEDPGHLPQSFLDRLLRLLTRSSATSFDFTRVGVRVPTVIVSPLIPRGTVGHDFLEHSSVPATLRAVFAPAAEPLGPRDRAAHTFHELCSLGTPRTDLPDLSRYAALPTRARVSLYVTPESETWMPNYYKEFLSQSDRARKHLQELGEPELPRLAEVKTRHDGVVFTAAFKKAADRHRRELDEG